MGKLACSALSPIDSLTIIFSAIVALTYFQIIFQMVLEIFKKLYLKSNFENSEIGNFAAISKHFKGEN